MVAESDGGGAITAYYVRAGNELLAVVRGGTARHVGHDGFGSVRELRDGTGVLADSYTYSAFGELTTRSRIDGQPYGFAGESFDLLTGLSYNRARWMAPSAGTFASLDLWEGRE